MNRLIYDHAHELQALGYSLVALEEGGKRPVMPGWQVTRSTHRLLDEWFSACPGINIGINCGLSKIAVADCDTPDAESWVRDNLPPSPWEQRTPRGGLHRPFYDPDGAVPPRVNLMNIGLDTRGRASQIVSSPSESRERRSRWQLIGTLVRPEDLPPIDCKLILPEPVWKPKEVTLSPLASRDRLAVRSYLSKIFSVSGSGGHNSCFRAACKLCDAGLSHSEAWEELCLWNTTNADPPWSEKELQHKLSGAFARKR